MESKRFQNSKPNLKFLQIFKIVNYNCKIWKRGSKLCQTPQNIIFLLKNPSDQPPHHQANIILGSKKQSLINFAHFFTYMHVNQALQPITPKQPPN
jgi:hypothetical protein